jgi:catechol 2,3-dioxygenase-like lactoylglutathione lyase family enzyme
MGIKSICGVILVSENPKRLAEFYGHVLEVEFEEEDHGDLAPHFGIDVGLLHFGIHPPGNLDRADAGGSRVTLAFNVESLDKTMHRLRQADVRPVQPPHDEGFGPVASYLDPDGNTFEIVELRYEFGDEEE